MSGRLKQFFDNSFGESSNCLKTNKSDRNDYDGDTTTGGDEVKNRDKKFSISRSGRFKQVNKHRDVLDTNLFADDKPVHIYI